MKKLIIIFVLIIPLFSFGQYDNTFFLNEFFFGRKPSARAESLGKGYSSIDGDLATIFYNPAGTATLQGVEIYTSFASPYYYLNKANYSFISAGYNFNKYLTIGISRNHFTAGKQFDIINSEGNVIIDNANFAPSLYSLNISSQPLKNFFIGVNVNWLSWQITDDKAIKSLYFDFGIIKKIKFGQRETTHHSVNIGASIANFNFARMKSKFSGYEINAAIPVVSRFGANYQFHWNKKLLIDTLNTFRFMFQTDYQLLLNSDYYNGFHSGMEFTILEMLSLRIGYYIENQASYYDSPTHGNMISEFTYGLGLQMPLNKLTKIPMIINFDYTSLPQSEYLNTQISWPNFSTFTLRASWIINK